MDVITYCFGPCVWPGMSLLAKLHIKWA